MDNGTLIALVTVIGSILTVCITSLVSIWTKWIDAQQKVKEHQLSIGSIYVNKKIEAAQEYIYNMNNLVAILSSENFYINLLIEVGEVDDESIKRYIDNYNKYSNIISNSKNYSALYFRQDNLYKIFDEIVNDKNVRQYQISYITNAIKDENYNKDNIDDDYDKLIQAFKFMTSLNNELINICKISANAINEELAKYDIL